MNKFIWAKFPLVFARSTLCVRMYGVYKMRDRVYSVQNTDSTELSPNKTSNSLRKILFEDIALTAG